MILPQCSKHLNAVQVRGLLKVGDLLVPGDARIPSFSHSHVIYEVDRILDYMTASDLGDFKILLFVFGILPRRGIQFLMEAAHWSVGKHAAWSAPLRQIQLGVKGVIMTLTYSQGVAAGGVMESIGWDAKCEPRGTESASVAQDAFQTVRRGSVLLKKLSVRERLVYMTRLKEVILKNQDEIVARLVQETKKTSTDALTSEIFGVLDHLQYLEKFAVRILADRKVHTPLVLLGKKSRVYFEPMGTILVISPWNYPFYQALVPITTALICGNSVVYKPSEHTPLQGLVEKLLKEAGIPENWVRVVYGDGALGQELIALKPQKIFFTGSTATGKKIMAQAAQHLIPVELELGGKDPMIVFEDVPIERAVRGALWGSTTNSGQSCTSVERLYIQESIYSEFKTALMRQMNSLVEQEDEQNLGRMTTPTQVRIVASHLQDALAHGAVQLAGVWDQKSDQIPPILLEGVTSKMKIFHEETFGPLLPIFSFKTEEEVIQKANDSEFGLSASVWSTDLKRAERVARAIQTGNISVNNVMISEGNHALPFGGIKNSGFGRYKGEFGLYSFSNVKSVILEGGSKKIEAHWFPYDLKKYALFKKLIGSVFGRGLVKLGFPMAGIKLEGYAAQRARWAAPKKSSLTE